MKERVKQGAEKELGGGRKDGRYCEVGTWKRKGSGEVGKAE